MNTGDQREVSIFLVIFSLGLDGIYASAKLAKLKSFESFDSIDPDLNRLWT